MESTSEPRAVRTAAPSGRATLPNCRGTLVRIPGKAAPGLHAARPSIQVPNGVLCRRASAEKPASLTRLPASVESPPGAQRRWMPAASSAHIVITASQCHRAGGPTARVAVTWRCSQLANGAATNGPVNCRSSSIADAAATAAEGAVPSSRPASPHGGAEARRPTIQAHNPPWPAPSGGPVRAVAETAATVGTSALCVPKPRGGSRQCCCGGGGSVGGRLRGGRGTLASGDDTHVPAVAPSTHTWGPPPHPRVAARTVAAPGVATLIQAG